MNTATMLHKISLCVLSAAVISACGGSDAPANVAAKYAGTWTSTCHADGDTIYHYQEVIALKSTSETTLSYQGSVGTYTDSACAGTPTDIADYAGVITVGAAASVSGTVVDQVTVTPADQDAIKNIMVVQGGTLRVGKKDAPLDASGFPTGIDSSDSLALAS